jgi:hypothetical protein
MAASDDANNISRLFGANPSAPTFLNPFNTSRPNDMTSYVKVIRANLEIASARHPFHPTLHSPADRFCPHRPVRLQITRPSSAPQTSDQYPRNSIYSHDCADHLDTNLRPFQRETSTPDCPSFPRLHRQRPRLPRHDRPMPPPHPAYIDTLPMNPCLNLHITMQPQCTPHTLTVVPPFSAQNPSIGYTSPAPWPAP